MPDHDGDLRPHLGQDAAHRWTHHDERLPVDPDLAPDDPGEPSPLHRPIPHLHRARQHKVLAAIGVGGFLGALGRYELLLTWNASPGHLPWATLAVNTSGAFLLGLILTVLLESGRPTRYSRPLLCVGVLGAWTTMSTFAVEADLLVKDGHPGVAASYAAATVIVGLSVTWAGILAGRALAVRRVARWASR